MGAKEMKIQKSTHKLFKKKNDFKLSERINNNKSNKYSL